MQVIALAGYPRSGKDTVVKTLRKLYPKYRIAQVAFADSLKQAHMAALGITSIKLYNEHLHDDLLYNGINLRTTIADLSEKLLEVNPSYNVDTVRNKIREFKSHDLVIISDLRYPIEYAYALINNYPVVRVTREKPTIEEKALRWNRNIENFVQQFTINNTGTLDDLPRVLEHLVSSLQLPLTK